MAEENKDIKESKNQPTENKPNVDRPSVMGCLRVRHREN
jgi:hypothetical protein